MYSTRSMQLAANSVKRLLLLAVSVFISHEGFLHAFLPCALLEDNEDSAFFVFAVLRSQCSSYTVRNGTAKDELSDYSASLFLSVPGFSLYALCPVLLSVPQKPQNGLLHLYPCVSERGPVPAQFSLPAD